MCVCVCVCVYVCVNVCTYVVRLPLDRRRTYFRYSFLPEAILALLCPLFSMDLSWGSSSDASESLVLSTFEELEFEASSFRLFFFEDLCLELF